MGVEIERKFKVKEGFRPTGIGIEMAQGYLSRDPKRTVRIRRSGMQGYLTIKGETHGAARLEYEYEIPAADAEELLALCEEPLVEKTRHRETVAGHVWEIDVFHGANAGLIVAEIELSAADEAFERPLWLGEEVSGDSRYLNASLMRLPFSRWRN